MRRKLAAGNWKMHGIATDLDQLTILARAHPDPAVDMLICPPATLISRAAQTLEGSAIAIGAQDCHPQASGAHTGDLSAAMLKDAGATHVILGHSERRTDHGETDKTVQSKAQVALTEGLVVLLCIGETLAQREAGETLAILSNQIAGSLPEKADPARLVIAYEPVWAIGTGLTPTPDQIAEAHAHMRSELTRHLGPTAAQD
ncbi:triose-phosphate isomerase family protein, partial [Aestuariivita boseongensis]|uniref:triose-phosphate isomerase family protein n=1 Tax=Aestuariivita boseongensis TaxID=1470562 RepID=UPI0012F96307